MRKVTTAQTAKGQWIACYDDAAYPNALSDTRAGALAILKAKANA